MRLLLVALALACGASTSGCGGGGGQVASAAVAVVDGVQQQPAAAPAPLPPYTQLTAPATPDAPLRGVVAEGDSISVFSVASHTGLYAFAHPTTPFHGAAVGGAGINAVVSRTAADLAFRPAVVTVLIGANDMANIPDVDGWLNDLWAWTARVRATGAKVAVGTVLPRYFASASTTALHNSRRAVANAAIREAVGSRIDAVIDFDADPLMGPDTAARDTRLYSDGVHPTDATFPRGLDGQARLLAIYAPVVDRLLAAP